MRDEKGIFEKRRSQFRHFQAYARWIRLTFNAQHISAPGRKLTDGLADEDFELSSHGSSEVMGPEEVAYDIPASHTPFRSFVMYRKIWKWIWASEPSLWKKWRECGIMYDMCIIFGSIQASRAPGAGRKKSPTKGCTDQAKNWRIILIWKSQRRDTDEISDLASIVKDWTVEKVCQLLMVNRLRMRTNLKWHSLQGYADGGIHSYV